MITTRKERFCRENFAKILLNTSKNLKIILLEHQNNFVGTLKIMNNAAKNLEILAISSSILHNYF